jgi:hypothetical protein
MLAHGEHDALGSVIALGYQVPSPPGNLFSIVRFHTRCLLPSYVRQAPGVYHPVREKAKELWRLCPVWLRGMMMDDG